MLQVTFWHQNKTNVSIELSYKAVAKLVSLQLQLYHSLYYNKNWKNGEKVSPLDDRKNYRLPDVHSNFSHFLSI